jgi:hypothetical protein
VAHGTPRCAASERADPLPATIQTSADRIFPLGFLGATKPDLGGLYAPDLLREVDVAAKP